MNRGILLILLAFAITNCKKDAPAEPPKEIAGIVGAWRSTEYTEMRGDTIIKHVIPKERSRVIIIRFDGVILDEDGKQSCGTPDSYLLNTKLIEVKPLIPIPTRMDCTGLVGVPCPQRFKINQASPDEITAEFCSVATRYTREK